MKQASISSTLNVFCQLKYMFVAESNVCFVLSFLKNASSSYVYQIARIFYTQERSTLGGTANDFWVWIEQKPLLKHAFNVHIPLLVPCKAAPAGRSRRSPFDGGVTAAQGMRQPWCLGMIARWGDAFGNTTSWQRLPNLHCNRSADHFSWRLLAVSSPPSIECIQFFVSGWYCPLLGCSFGLRSSHAFH